MEIMEIRSKKESAIRPTTAATGIPLHVIKTDWELAEIAPQSEEITKGSLKWRAIRIGAISGYIAMTSNVELRPIAEPPTEPPAEELFCVTWDGYEVCGTREQLAWGRELVDGLMKTILAQFDAPTRL